MDDLFESLPDQKEMVAFEPTREAGLQRLEQFVSRTARHYTSQRNYDFGPDHRSNTSVLSPWIKHRLVTEEDVLTRVLSAHSPASADKYIQEVFWRTYFKGWLEQRPSVWAHYLIDLQAAKDRLTSDASLNAHYQTAIRGQTGIDCFDHWAQELVATGYLHNHARMWFASIWIFTLRLPWQLGADFFLHQLLDGDPASNTLSWRWVAGLHTKGKTYLARPDNIAKYTRGRFKPVGLANVAVPCVEQLDYPRQPLPAVSTPETSPYLFLVTEEDLKIDDQIIQYSQGVIGLLPSSEDRAQMVQDFKSNAMKNTLAPLGTVHFASDDWSVPLIEATQHLGVKEIRTHYAPLGDTRTQLDRAEPKLREAGLTLHRIMRPYDSLCWPHAKAGFFGFKKQIPEILKSLSLTP